MRRSMIAVLTLAALGGQCRPRERGDAHGHQPTRQRRPRHVGLTDGNGDDGVAIRGDGNVVGPDNVISRNHNGVGLDDLSDENQIVGNLIGTDALGTTAIGNSTGIDLRTLR